MKTSVALTLSGLMAGVGGRVWQPSMLFTNGEVGAWFDPSNLDTLFQDAYGSAPVASPGNTVGMILDQQRTLGSDVKLTVNEDRPPGSFDTETGEGTLVWEVEAPIPFVQWRPEGTTEQPFLIDIEHLEGDPIVLRRGGTSAAVVHTISEGQRATLIWWAGSGLLTLTLTQETHQASFKVHSLRKVAGFHARQTTAGERPAYQVVSGVHFLRDDEEDDSLVVDLPADDYTIAYVDSEGNVTVQEEVSISGTENVLKTPELAGILYINRALTVEEKALLADWWQP